MAERLNPNVTAILLTAVSKVYLELDGAAKTTPSKGGSELLREVRDQFQIIPGHSRPISEETLRTAIEKVTSK